MQANEITVNHGVDFPDLMARVENDWELLREIIGIFMEECPRMTREMNDAYLCGDLERVRTLAHTLKGMLASLSCLGASSTAMRIENLARRFAGDEIAAELERFGSQTALASAYLGGMCGEIIR